MEGDGKGKEGKGKGKVGNGKGGEGCPPIGQSGSASGLEGHQCEIVPLLEKESQTGARPILQVFSLFDIPTTHPLSFLGFVVGSFSWDFVCTPRRLKTFY